LFRFSGLELLMVDPFEEFEFKPLTEGLGFHKKAEKIKRDVKTSSFASVHSSGHSSGELKLNTAVSAKASKASAEAVAAPRVSSLFSGELPDISNAGLASESVARPASQSISDLIASLPPSLDFIDEKPEVAKPSSRVSMTATSPLKADSRVEAITDRPQIFQPLNAGMKTPSGPTIGSMLPTPGSKAAAMTPTAPAVPAPVSARSQSSPYRERLDESFARAFPHVDKNAKKETDTAVAAVVDTTLEGLVKSPVFLAAGILDTMVVAGVSTILLVAILAITRINLVGMLSNASTDFATQLNLGLLTLAVTQMYFLIARSFFGASLGEWAFDQQLGSDADRDKLTYALKVAWRTLLVTLTGFVIFPVLSALFRKDLASSLTGLQLYRRA
jgi:hypothetical protein